MLSEYKKNKPYAIVKEEAEEGFTLKYRLNAYAKVNIGLRVLPKREDGYHPLKTYFHLIDLHDVIEIDIEDSESLVVKILGNEEYLEEGKVDLMEKACRLFFEESKETFSAFIKIEKNIPHQAGLGGGSSDAASVLLVLNKHFNNILSKEKIDQIALTLGSDVPFFTSGYIAAYAEGRGEILKEVEPLSYPLVLLMKRGDKMSTKEAFKELDKELTRSDTIPSWPLPLSSWKGSFINDFMPLQNLPKEPLYKTLTSFSAYDSVSGSGSACFLIFPSVEEVEKFNIILNQLEIPYLIFFTAFCCKTLLKVVVS